MCNQCVYDHHHQDNQCLVVIVLLAVSHLVLHRPQHAVNKQAQSGLLSVETLHIQTWDPVKLHTSSQHESVIVTIYHMII